MKDSKNNIAKKTLMSEAEILDMQRKIDEGIALAQQRLIARAVHNQTTLVVAKGDKVVEVQADELLAQVQQPARS
mgnify:CR=1 FL=1